MQGVVIPAIGPNTFPRAVGDVGRLSMPGSGSDSGSGSRSGSSLLCTSIYCAVINYLAVDLGSSMGVE